MDANTLISIAQLAIPATSALVTVGVIMATSRTNSEDIREIKAGMKEGARIMGDLKTASAITSEKVEKLEKAVGNGGGLVSQVGELKSTVRSMKTVCRLHHPNSAHLEAEEA